MYLPYDYYRNSERYADPTAGEAMMNVMLEQKKQQAEKQCKPLHFSAPVKAKTASNTPPPTARALSLAQ